MTLWHWGATCCKYCIEDHCVCLLMALLTYHRTRCFLLKHRCCSGRGREQVKDFHERVLRKSGGGEGLNSTALVSSEKDQWFRQAARFCLRAANECFSQLIQEMLTIMLAAPSFPSQGCNSTCVNHKSKPSPDMARRGMYSHRQPDFASFLVHLFFDLCHIILVGSYLHFSSGWTFTGCKDASWPVHLW